MTQDALEFCAICHISGGYGDRSEICRPRAGGGSAAQLALQELPLILCVVAHELAAYRAEAVDPVPLAGARSGNQCATLLAMMDHQQLCIMVYILFPYFHIF